ncbi:MAG: hypothetical protein V1664_03870 [Candidatus Uhrbacteria bacterium]
MKKTIVKTKTKTSVVVGIALLAVAGLSAAAAISMAALPPKLVVRLSNTITSATYTKGSTADMIGVALTASSGPAVVSSLSFYVLADNDASFTTVENDVVALDFISSCSLYDSRDTLIRGPRPVDASGLLVFDALNMGIGKNKTQNYKVSCNFANVTTAGSDDDIYALTINNESDVVASKVNGTALTGRNLDIGDVSDSGINVSGSLVNTIVTDHGDLDVSLDLASPDSTIIVPNMIDFSVGIWKFVSTNEPFEINTLTFGNVNDSLSSGNDGIASVVRLKCFDSNGNELIYNQYLANHLVQFSNLSCYVPKDNEAQVEVLIDTVPPLAGLGIDPYFTPQFSLTLYAWFSNNNPSNYFAATGLNSGTAFDSYDINKAVSANGFNFYQTYPILSLASGSPSGSSVPGMNEVFIFNVAANSTADVGLTQVSFKITSTDNDNSGWNLCSNAALADSAKFVLYDIDDLSVPLAFSTANIDFLTADGTSCLSSASNEPLTYVVFGRAAAGPAFNIPAGTTKTFVLYTDTTGASVSNDDSVRIDVPTDTDILIASHFSYASIFWEDGYVGTSGSLVQTLPLYGGTITY